jgi:hypothetical protein
VTGWKKTTSLILISITALSIPSVFLLNSPGHAHAAGLSHRLTVTRYRLRHARIQLARDRRAYTAALAAVPGVTAAADSAAAVATPAPTPAPPPTAAPVPSLRLLRIAVRVARHRVRVLTRAAGRLRYEMRLKTAAARGDWMPIVRDAAAHSHISAVGLRRMMSFESGGRLHAENGSFHGLFQYCWSTWRAAWNPWRHHSLYDGEAQIRATAVAIRRGWGPSMWPNTYPRAF